ncbi:MAG: DUF1499 domain-containing protein [Pegethrix bostrychoides GSE-TBD4-15B]|uniref:DUF1499 domain-containing protein n=1 Tax=Pegethrix bostrychoides GSE-TBD4-15B TaxID=2839662 RepID=A0A951U4F7_9CYAN|nr:DUF1499 domain-containing protein [Pegethrix bostrychoides GSE-TBD4-15B]
MVQSGFSLMMAVVLTLCCWWGAAPASAQPVTLNMPTTLLTGEIAMGSKSLFSFSGKRPENLGVKNSKLAVCPNTPNCVSSQMPDSDAEHKINPLAYNSAPAEALAKLKSIITSMERSEIISETGDYIYAEFASALMGYVDDVEFYVDPSQPNQIQVRSASRLGQSDLGVNRKRIEEIRSKLSSMDA